MPKCASSSIESALAKHCNINFSGKDRIKHINAQDFRDYILAYHTKVLGNSSILTFCLMRDPTDWLFSWYRYRQRNHLKKPDHPFAHNYTGDISFDTFVEAYLSPEERPSFARLPRQMDFLRLRNGDLGVDRIFDMNRIDLVAEFLSERIGEQIEIPRKNVAPKMEMELSEALSDRLREFLQEDEALYRQVHARGVFSVAG